MRVKLKALVGKSAGKTFRIPTERFLIGRSQKCHLRPRSEAVSRYHCVIAEREGKLLLQDLKSRNGTFVNGKRLPEDRAVSLHHGDHLQVGNLDFEVLIKTQVPDVSAKRPVDRGEEKVAKAQSHVEPSSHSEVDISEWLEEVPPERDSASRSGDTRNLVLEEADETSGIVVNEQAEEEKEEEGSHAALIRELKEKQKRPGKLPLELKMNAQFGDSRDAAGKALKDFFKGR